MDERREIRGSCLCGAVRYVVRGAPLLSDYCHCSRCRKFSGAPADPGMTVRLADFDLQGREALRVFKAEGFSDRAFCATCGCSLFAGRDLFSAESLSLCMGSLDSDPGIRPALRKGVAWNAPWLPSTQTSPATPRRPRTSEASVAPRPARPRRAKLPLPHASDRLTPPARARADPARRRKTHP